MNFTAVHRGSVLCLSLSLSLSARAGEREGIFARRAISLAALRSAFREFARTNKLAALRG